MATELGKAYVQIVPSAKGIHGSISNQLNGEADAAGKSSGESLGNSLVSKVKGIIAAAGIGSFVKSALDAGGDLQQSFGGLDTLYGDASAAAKEYAAQAASAGISMNDYAEQAVSFGASLKSAFAGDTAQAVEAANTAIMDMADNAAKMGTPLESIQNAYQGFAKQNYTMLDNLKLGYGGTKEEMERLLADAEKISGVHYDLDNLGDVYEAIHVMQGELGLTGVAAEEASTTFTGSMGAMKAAAQNFLATLTTGGDISGSLYTLIDSAKTFIMNNMVPMVASLISALPETITTIWVAASSMLKTLAADSGSILQFVTTFLGSLAESFMWMVPQLIFTAGEILGQVLQAIIEFDWLSFGGELISNLEDALNVTSREYGLGGGIMEVITDFISEGLPNMLTKGAEIVTNIVNGIGEALPGIISSATEIVNQILSTLLASMPDIMQKGFEAVSQIAQGILNNLPQIVSSIGTLIGTLLATIVSHLPEILLKGVEIVLNIITGIIQSIPQIISSIGDLCKQVIEAFKTVDWASVGTNLIEGIKDGLFKAASGLWDAVKDIAEQALKKVKGFLGIASPSKVFRDQVGQFIPAGIAEGILENSGMISDSVNAVMDGVTGTASANIDLSPSANGTDIGTVIALLQAYLPGCAEKEIYLDNGTMVGQMMPKINERMGVRMAFAGRGI